MDLALWKRPQQSGTVLGAATVVFYVFQYLRYTALSLLAHVLLAAVLFFFLWTSWCRFKNRCAPPMASPQRRRGASTCSALSVRPAFHVAGPRPRCPSWRCRRPKCGRWWPRRLTLPTRGWPYCTSWAPDKTLSSRRRCVAVAGSRVGHCPPLRRPAGGALAHHLVAHGSVSVATTGVRGPVPGLQGWQLVLLHHTVLHGCAARASRAHTAAWERN